MIKFVLTEIQAQNLISYLNRTEIKGSEAPAWMDLTSSIIKQAREGGAADADTK